MGGSERSVLVISYNWPPDLSVGAVRPVHLARGLSRIGWRPVVLTVDERYYDLKHPETALDLCDVVVVRTRRLLSPREVYAFLKRLVCRAKEKAASGQEAARTRADIESPRWRTWFKKTILSLVNMPDEYIGWVPFGVWRGLRVIREYKIDCIVSTAPFFTAHLVAGLISFLSRVPWVAEFRDPWSANVHKSSGGKSGVSERLARTMERWVVQAASRVVCVTSVMTEAYRTLYPSEPPEKWATITNGFDKEEFRKMGFVRPNQKFTITYLGSFNYFRRPHLLLKSIADLLCDGSLRKEEVRVRLIGECRYVDGQLVEDLVKQYGLEGVCEIVDLLPRMEVFREMMEAQVLLLLANEQPLQIPGKTFEYMGSGRRVLAVTESTSATAEVVRSTGIGRVITPGDHSAMKEVLREWYGEYCTGGITDRDLSGRGNDQVMEYEWEVLAARYGALLASCVSRIRMRPSNIVPG